MKSEGIIPQTNQKKKNHLKRKKEFLKRTFFFKSKVLSQVPTFMIPAQQKESVAVNQLIKINKEFMNFCVRGEIPCSRKEE